jgi:hypothetical protein
LLQCNWTRYGAQKARIVQDDVTHNGVRKAGYK